MLTYLLRRLLYAIPIVLGVNLLTFLLFFQVNTPDTMARLIKGDKAKPEVIEAWKREHGYHLPKMWNGGETGLSKVTQTILYQKSAGLLRFDFGRSDQTDVRIGDEIRRRMGPSLAYAVPTFLLALFVEIVIAMIAAYARGTYLDGLILLYCVVLMSVAAMFYIIGGQYLFGIFLRIAPISGYQEGIPAARFLGMPVLVGVLFSIGGAIRFDRTVFLEEIGKDYVRTARSKGLSEAAVMFVHVLKNAMIPILTSVVFSIPFLFMGSLLTEAFFSIPGLGGYTIQAIGSQDFAVVRAMVYLGAILYVVSQILTDFSYTLVDPRVRLDKGGGGGLRGALHVLAGLGLLVGGTWALVELVRSFQESGAGKSWNPYMAGNLCVAGLLALLAWFVLQVLPREPWRTASRQLRSRPSALGALALLSLFSAVGLMDSVSWRDPMRDPAGKPRFDEKGRPVLQAQGRSLLDRSWSWIHDRGELDPKTEAVTRRAEGLLAHLWSGTLSEPPLLKENTYSAPLASIQFSRNMVIDRQGKAAWESPALKHPGRHWLGTDKVGNDVLLQSLKGVRTALIIGGLTTLIAIPFAVLFGVLAGYFGGWVDDVIQYVYTTLASIPSILLISAFVLIYGRGLIQLCVILGLMSWTGLCRLVRAETIKLREMEYVQAAATLGVSRLRILLRHVVPNLMHLVLISAVLSFSGLVLYETALAYIGVGVGTETGSWGNMINNARMELSRDPVVWWSLLGSFAGMFLLVLPANLFGDALRDALDPRLRTR